MPYALLSCSFVTLLYCYCFFERTKWRWRWRWQNEPNLLQIGTMGWNDRLFGQKVKGQGHWTPKLNLLTWRRQTFCTEIVHCFPGPSSILFIRSYLVEHSSSSATALITDTRTVQVFAQGVIVCVIVTAHALVTVLCYLCVLKCLFIIIVIIINN